jgi:hypothetical protein
VERGRETATGAGKTAHHSSDWYPEPIGSLLVAALVRAHQEQYGALLVGQSVHCGPHFIESRGNFRNEAPILTLDIERPVDCLIFAFRLAFADRIDPQILHDPKYPAVEPRARGPLSARPQRALAGSLYEVVSLDG